MNSKLTKVFAALLSLIFVQPIISLAQDPSSTPRFYGMPAGTLIKVKMDTEINSESAETGDTFTVTVSEPVKVGGLVVLPSGIVIEGRVVDIRRAASGRRNGRIDVRFETLFLDEENKRSIEGTIERTPEKEGSSTVDFLAIVSGAAAGGIIGAVTGSRNAALIGAGIGGAAGTGVAVLREGSVERIRTGEEFGVRLKKPVSLPAEGF